MRFGISAISAILPKYLRNRLRPVKERVIRYVLFAARVGPLVPRLLINKGEHLRSSGGRLAGRQGGNEICTRVGLFNPPRLLTSPLPSRLPPRAASSLPPLLPSSH